MVSALVSASNSPGSKPGWGHCIVFLDIVLCSWTLYCVLGHCIVFRGGLDQSKTSFPCRFLSE